MGWLWGSSTAPDDDPYRDLDPELRDYLIKESPVKYKPAAPRPPTPELKPQNPSAAAPKIEEPEPKVPPQSLFQDGRYAHLWTNYKPLGDVEDALKSDQEKLSDVLDGYKERKHQIGRVALENCANEQIELQDCYEHGSIADKMVLCRKQKKAYYRCYTMQSRFLKALGYLSTFDRPESVDEQIQMHADTLYHRMLDQEKAIEEAKAASRPMPEPDKPESEDKSSSPSKKAVKAEGSSVEELPPLSTDLTRKLRPEAQLELRKKLKDLTPVEREVEEKSIMGEYEADRQVAEEVARLRDSVNESRKQRREEGKATAGDTISGWFGW